MRRNKAQTSKVIMDAAYVLFRQSGYTRVNVDQIADKAGITKRTLYSHFESKDALLAAVLESQHAMAFEAFQTFGRKLNGGPSEIVRCFFAELFSWSGSPKWPGSGFTRLALELADLPGHPARRIAARHKKQLETHLTNVLADAGLPNAPAFARQMFILSEGAMALTLIHGDRAYCKAAEAAALSLIDR